MSTFTLEIKLMTNERLEVLVESNSVSDIHEQLAGNKLTFIHDSEPDQKSFTLFAHHIASISYQKNDMGALKKHKRYTILSSF